MILNDENGLFPCPFCGGKAHIMRMGFPHWIYCERCGAKVHGGLIGEGEGEEASRKAWNRRATLCGYNINDLVAVATLLRDKAITADELSGFIKELGEGISLGLKIGADTYLEELKKFMEGDDDG